MKQMRRFINLTIDNIPQGIGDPKFVRNFKTKMQRTLKKIGNSQNKIFGRQIVQILNAKLENLEF